MELYATLYSHVLLDTADLVCLYKCVITHLSPCRLDLTHPEPTQTHPDLCRHHLTHPDPVKPNKYHRYP